MTECSNKDTCAHLQELLAEKDRLEKWLQDKDTLITLATDEIKKRDERIKELELQIQNIEKARQESSENADSKDKEDTENSEEKKEPKQRGAPKGHPGATRPKPKHIDKHEHVYAERCEKCGSKNIKHSNNSDDHIVEDVEIIILPKTTCHHHYGYYCYDCKYTGHSGPGKDEIPYSYIGPVAKSIAAYLRYQVGTTYGQVERILSDLLNLTVTRSALVGFDKAIYQKGKSFYEMLKKKLYLSPYCCVDETGWLVLAYGPGQMWTFTNDTIALYLINKSRGSKVITLVLGEDYLGILVSDCFSSYNPVSAGAKQKCIPHIMRKNKELEEFPEVLEFVNQIKDLFQRALQLKKDYKSGHATDEELAIQSAEFKNELLKIIAQELKNKEAEKLRGRLIKHQDELFTFLVYPHVPPDNNLAERTLKPPIIHRKLMYFNTSEQGARYYEVIMTLTQTAKKNGQKNTMELIKKLLTGCPPEEIIKLLLGEHAKENPPEAKEPLTPEYTPLPEIVPEPELALVGSGYH